MRVLPKLFLLVVIGAVALLLIIMMNRHEFVPQTYRSEANLSFSVALLPGEQRVWYDRLWAAINGNTYPDAERYAASNDTYSMGRALQPHIMALYTAFRATGDVRLLDEMDRLMEIARAQLADTNFDGYLNWLWQFDPNDSTYYRTDLHEMDEILTHNLVAFFAYVLRENQAVKPQYREHADFWQDYLVNHFIAKWEARGRGTLMLEKSLTHVYAHLMTFYYYLYRLTGDSAYLAEARQRADVLYGMMTASGAALTWDHRVPDYGHPPLGCQPINYARYTLSAFQQMAYEEFSYFADPAYMARFAATIRDNLLLQEGSIVAEDVCGDTGDTHASIDYILSLMTCYARWDVTGDIARSSVTVYEANAPQSASTVFVPACMVSLLSAA